MSTKILAFDTEGNPPGNFEDRIRTLLRDFDLEYFPFNPKNKLASAFLLFQRIGSLRPNLVVMEGTGSAGGIAVILARWIYGVPYVFSSGDAVAPFLSLRFPWLAFLFWIYEWLLFSNCAGFIGWTPYLSGRALTLGARRAVVAAGWSPFQSDELKRIELRKATRARYQIPEDALVIGIVGSLAWNDRVGYCYGLEIVRAIKKLSEKNIYGLIVGGGSGFERLQREAGPMLGKRLILSGPVPRHEVEAHLVAMDIGSLPQSVDAVGGFRYTTKISEYVEADLPFVTGQIPLAYDFGSRSSSAVWRLPGSAPWDVRYIDALADLLAKINTDEVSAHQKALASLRSIFDREEQVKKVTEFICDLVQTVDR